MSQHIIEQVYFEMHPKTYKEMQKVIMALAKSNSNRGKVGVFGGDKHEKSLKKLNKAIQNLCYAIDYEKAIKKPSSFNDAVNNLEQNGDYLEYIDILINMFSTIWPMWGDACSYWEYYYSNHKITKPTK